MRKRLERLGGQDMTLHNAWGPWRVFTVIFWCVLAVVWFWDKCQTASGS